MDKKNKAAVKTEEDKANKEKIEKAKKDKEDTMKKYYKRLTADLEAAYRWAK